MTLVDADEYQARERLAMVLDNLEECVAHGPPTAEPLVTELAVAVVQLGRYLLASQR